MSAISTITADADHSLLGLPAGQRIHCWSCQPLNVITAGVASRSTYSLLGLPGAQRIHCWSCQTLNVFTAGVANRSTYSLLGLPAAQRIMVLSAKQSFFFHLSYRTVHKIFLVSGVTCIIIHHQLGLNGHVSASSNSLFKSLPSCLLPTGPQFSIILVILLLFILVTCRGQFDLYLLRLSGTGSTFNSFKISSFLLWSIRASPALLLKIFIARNNTQNTKIVQIYMFIKTKSKTVS